MNATACRQAETKIFVCQHPFSTVTSGMIVTGRHAEQNQQNQYDFQEMVPQAGIEPALLAEPHFECGASTNSAIGATVVMPRRLSRARPCVQPQS